MKSIEDKVEEVMEVRDDLCNDWEWEFIESVQEQLEQGRELSEKQEDVIERLYERACRSPY